MANAFYCDDCGSFEKGVSAGKLTEHGDEYTDRTDHDLCSDCLGTHVQAVERSADDASLDEYGGGDGE